MIKVGGVTILWGLGGLQLSFPFTFSCLLTKLPPPTATSSISRW